MQWSKLRTQIEDMFADSVKGRVRLHSTRYRKMHDQDGRSWITLDGNEIINMPHIFKWLYERDKRAAALAGVSDLRDWQNYDHLLKQAEKDIHRDSSFWQGDLGNAMYRYLTLSIEEIHESDNALVRAIGILDRRTGKRSLLRMNVQNEHPLVQMFYLFRCDAENLNTTLDHGMAGGLNAEQSDEPESRCPDDSNGTSTHAPQ